MALSSSILPYYYYTFVSLFIFSFAFAKKHSNITIGSTLIAGDIPSSWVSPSKDFAFGFQETKPGSYLLAIWFNKIPEKTITWSANRDHLAPKGSKLELTKDRGLILSDPNGREIWSTRAMAVAYSAAVLDTGNFVLVNQASAVVWQSFDDPTDTLLPTQTLHQGNRLIASFSKNDYSSGRFSFDLGYNGNLALYTTDFPLYNSLNSAYDTFEDQGLGYQVGFAPSGNLYLADNTGNVLVNIFPKQEASSQGLYQRVTLEYDGVLRQFMYNTKETTRGRSKWFIKSFTPDNICTAVIQQTGSGVCGFNSYCKLGDDSRPRCICPPGYAMLDPINEFGGCFQSFLGQSCKPGAKQKQGNDHNNKYDFGVLRNVDWPLSDYEHFENVSVEWCKKFCLDDCFCAVAIFRETGDCWKKKIPLSNGKNDTSVDRIAFVKIRMN